MSSAVQPMAELDAKCNTYIQQLQEIVEFDCKSLKTRGRLLLSQYNDSVKKLTMRKFVNEHAADVDFCLTEIVKRMQQDTIVPSTLSRRRPSKSESQSKMDAPQRDKQTQKLPATTMEQRHDELRASDSISTTKEAPPSSVASLHTNHGPAVGPMPQASPKSEQAAPSTPLDTPSTTSAAQPAAPLPSVRPLPVESGESGVEDDSHHSTAPPASTTSSSTTKRTTKGMLVSPPLSAAHEDVDKLTLPPITTTTTTKRRVSQVPRTAPLEPKPKKRRNTIVRNSDLSMQLDEDENTPREPLLLHIRAPDHPVLTLQLTQDATAPFEFERADDQWKNLTDTQKQQMLFQLEPLYEKLAQYIRELNS
ncbi:hypothetical protein BC940DRAFT_102040 [Gongronella butleri]|nr:hypothetical protein BC940DRAFT_102040 [Gongronella butleri]